jgi:D-alanyl-lipoteichoic acid acyltransferase DltB (MBOAT superfamily)
MLFNSLAFFVFFPLVTLAYFALPHRFRWVLLLAASLYFYGFWKPSYLFFLGLSTSIDFAVARLIGREKRPLARRLLLTASLVANFGLLFLFKYLGFFARSIEWALAASGSSTHLRVPELLLPVGISFYTFQTVSYVVDVYRGEREPETHFGKFALFVAFFPHLVAGPIVRAKKLIPQFSVEHRWDYARVVSGLGWMLWGFFKKVVIADRAAAIVNVVYPHPERYQGTTIVIATYAFAFQIYCDFSGYSDIAIGAARVLGIELTKNFDDPYSSASMVELWRRWHISLSTWFRDYVYVPLGGNRVGPVRRSWNLFVVFLLSGLWHGASWTFVAWGAFHGVMIIATNAVTSLAARLFKDRTWSPGFLAILRVMGVVLTFHLVCIGWVFFRAKDLAQAKLVFAQLDYFLPVSTLHELTHLGPLPPDAMEVELVILVASIVALQIVNAFLRRKSPPRLAGAFGWVAWSSLAVWVLFTGLQAHTPFIYFQF